MFAKPPDINLGVSVDSPDPMEKCGLPALRARTPESRTKGKKHSGIWEMVDMAKMSDFSVSFSYSTASLGLCIFMCL